jgi:hypothetical protein
MSQNYQNEAQRTFCIFPNSKIQNAITNILYFCNVVNFVLYPVYKQIIGAA